jgi:hypothetical protein
VNCNHLTANITACTLSVLPVLLLLLLLCPADAVVATSMSIINRLCLLVFPLPTVVLLVQMASTLAILYPLLLSRALNFQMFNGRRFKSLLGISFLYTANTAFALFGLKGMNLPM